MSNTIIGLTGSFGSGCTHIAREYIETRGFRYLSLSDILKRLYTSEKGEEVNNQTGRRLLQDFGNSVREERGGDYLADQAISIMTGSSEVNKWVIDGIKNPMEVKALRKHSSFFFLFGVFADRGIRYSRAKGRYPVEAVFDQDDRKDAGDEEEPSGQRVRECFKLSDVIISNNVDCEERGSEDEKLLQHRMDRYLGCVDGKRFLPTDSEALMAMAYATGFRSKCLKRKVGAIIVSARGHVIGSGHNEVPPKELSCREQPYKMCYRDKLRAEFAQELSVTTGSASAQDVERTYRRRLKVMDYCRSLHAEETAIVTAQMSGSLRGATLYATTYPCNLCANKIALAGIRKVIYLEPYPMKEAKEILTNARVKQVPFEGVTYHGYFRFAGGVNGEAM